MNDSIKFDYKKLEKLNNPERIKSLNPDLIWETLNLENPQVIIDIGAGTGFFAKAFAKKAETVKIFACDISDVMISWMKDNVSSENIIPIKSDENKVPLNSNTADLVYLINVYHELEEPVQLLLEVYRLLKQGGKIAIIDWKKEETPEGPPVAHRVEESIIFEKVKSAGFSNIKNYNILPYHSFLVAEK